MNYKPQVGWIPIVKHRDHYYFICCNQLLTLILRHVSVWLFISELIMCMVLSPREAERSGGAAGAAGTWRAGSCPAQNEDRSALIQSQVVSTLSNLSSHLKAWSWDYCVSYHAHQPAESRFGPLSVPKKVKKDQTSAQLQHTLPIHLDVTPFKDKHWQWNQNPPNVHALCLLPTWEVVYN